MNYDFSNRLDLDKLDIDFVAKPRFGKGSQDIFLINNNLDLQNVIHKYNDMMKKTIKEHLKFIEIIDTEIIGNNVILGK